MSRPSMQATPAPGAGHRRWMVLIAVAALAAAVGVWTATRSSGQPRYAGGGDPGGRILRALQPVSTAVPAGATDVSTAAHESAHTARCPDNPGGRSGWSAVTVMSSFRSALPGPGVVAAIGGGLTRLGWHRVTPVWDHTFDQYRPRAAWQKTLFAGQTATAAVYQLPAGTGTAAGTWHFGAFAEPPGFALPGC